MDVAVVDPTSSNCAAVERHVGPRLVVISTHVRSFLPVNQRLPILRQSQRDRFRPTNQSENDTMTQLSSQSHFLQQFTEARIGAQRVGHWLG